MRRIIRIQASGVPHRAASPRRRIPYPSKVTFARGITCARITAESHRFEALQDVGTDITTDNSCLLLPLNTDKTRFVDQLHICNEHALTPLQLATGEYAAPSSSASPAPPQVPVKPEIRQLLIIANSGQKLPRIKELAADSYTAAAAAATTIDTHTIRD